MVSLKEQANQYEPPKTKNIADLDVVDVSIEIEEREGTNNNGESFKYKVIVVDDQEYRVPNSVISSLKAILQQKPDLQKFSVTSSGSRMDTRYTVIPQ